MVLHGSANQASFFFLLLLVLIIFPPAAHAALRFCCPLRDGEADLFAGILRLVQTVPAQTGSRSNEAERVSVASMSTLKSREAQDMKRQAIHVDIGARSGKKSLPKAQRFYRSFFVIRSEVMNVQRNVDHVIVHQRRQTPLRLVRRFRDASLE